MKVRRQGATTRNTRGMQRRRPMWTGGVVDTSVAEPWLDRHVCAGTPRPSTARCRSNAARRLRRIARRPGWHLRFQLRQDTSCAGQVERAVLLQHTTCPSRRVAQPRGPSQIDSETASLIPSTRSASVRYGISSRPAVETSRKSSARSRRPRLGRAESRRPFPRVRAPSRRNRTRGASGPPRDMERAVRAPSSSPASPRESEHSVLEVVSQGSG